MFDYTDEIELQNGNPIVNSIDAKAKELLADILKEDEEGKVGK